MDQFRSLKGSLQTCRGLIGSLAWGWFRSLKGSLQTCPNNSCSVTSRSSDPSKAVYKPGDRSYGAPRGPGSDPSKAVYKHDDFAHVILRIEVPIPQRQSTNPAPATTALILSVLFRSLKGSLQTRESHRPKKPT